MTADSEQRLAQAAGHLAAAAELLEASDSSDQVFSPARALATQLLLIGHGLRPGVAAATEEFAPVGTASAHLDYALTLIDSLDSEARPADLFLWHSRLTELRSRVTSLTAPWS